jgi:hypothetical protein
MRLQETLFQEGRQRFGGFAVNPVSEVGQQAWPGKKVIEANEFILKDKDGNLRGLLGFADNGEPRLTLLGSKGLSVVEVGLRHPAGNPGVVLTDAAGQFRAGILLDEAGNPSFTIHGRNGKARLGLFAEEGNATGVVVFDEAETPRLRVLWQQDDDQPVVALHDRKGSLRAALQLQTGGLAELICFDAGGLCRSVIAEGLVATLDPTGKPTWFQGEGATEPPVDDGAGAQPAS